jgi:hypothetical protein
LCQLRINSGISVNLIITFSSSTPLTRIGPHVYETTTSQMLAFGGTSRVFRDAQCTINLMFQYQSMGSRKSALSGKYSSNSDGSSARARSTRHFYPSQSPATATDLPSSHGTARRTTSGASGSGSSKTFCSKTGSKSSPSVYISWSTPMPISDSSGRKPVSDMAAVMLTACTRRNPGSLPPPIPPPVPQMPSSALTTLSSC